MHPTPTADTKQLVATIRRLIRVFGSQPAHVTEPERTRSTAKLLYSRLERSGLPVRWVTGDHDTPLIIAGRGPVAISTYLDDIHPDAIAGNDEPPEVTGDVVKSNGIERKAALIAHVAGLLAEPEWADSVTLLIETDRHAGSHTLEQWLADEAPAFSSAAWEVSDLPLSSPVLVRAATGTLIVEIAMSAARHNVEPVYGTVLPDLGLAIARLVSSLKSSDDEVRIEGFYDGIAALEEFEVDSLVTMGPGVSRWLTRVAGAERELSTSHMTLGMFCAPSLVVRQLHVSANNDYLPETASAVIEFQLLPGQDVHQVINALKERVMSSPFDIQVTPLLVRHPVNASKDIAIPAHMTVIPIAPGPSPASLFAQHGISGIGYALVQRTTDRDQAGVSLDLIAAASTFLHELTDNLGTTRA